MGGCAELWAPCGSRLDSCADVSVDIDTADIWVVKAILDYGFRPKVFSVEYNSNFPEDATPIVFPDPSTMQLHNTHTAQTFGWGRTCFMGSSATAIEEMMASFDYVLTNVSIGTCA